MSEESEKKGVSKKEWEDEEDEENDAEELERVLSVVSEKVPALLNALSDVLYGREQSKKYAEAVATFYKALIEAGMDKQQAYELTKEYMENLNLAGTIGKVINKAGNEDMGKDIEEAVKAKVKEKLKEKGVIQEREEEK
ncbi:MAG: hypothetical protein ACPL1Y_07500 [Thermoplasmata archaeon]